MVKNVSAKKLKFGFFFNDAIDSLIHTKYVNRRNNLSMVQLNKMIVYCACIRN